MNKNQSYEFKKLLKPVTEEKKWIEAYTAKLSPQPQVRAALGLLK